MTGIDIMRWVALGSKHSKGVMGPNEDVGDALRLASARPAWPERPSEAFVSPAEKSNQENSV